VLLLQVDVAQLSAEVTETVHKKRWSETALVTHGVKLSHFGKQYFFKEVFMYYQLEYSMAFRSKRRPVSHSALAMIPSITHHWSAG
jgi:hypothetical protein